MSNIKHPKNPNPRGNLNAAIGRPLYEELEAIAQKENRSINRQVAVIIREWIQQRQAMRDPTAAGG